MNPIRPPFARTTCGCAEDVENCKTRPGMLMPSDIALIATKLVAMGVLEKPGHIEALLRNSPGAVLAHKNEDGTLTKFRVETIAPATDETGRCVFLTKNNQCAIHDVAPAGCAYFDVHQDKATADGRSLWIHRVIALDKDYNRLRRRLQPSVFG